jgi:hypothetical protein
MTAMLSCLPVWASSVFWFGVIEGVQQDKDGTATISTLELAYGYRPEASHRLRNVKIAADVPIYLDWKRSTLAEALKPGRTYVFFTNHKQITDPQGNPMSGPFTGSRGGGALLVSTTPAPAHSVALSDPECRLLIATLDQPGDLASLSAAAPSKKACDARLVLALENGRIASGFAWTTGLAGGAWHEADVSRLKFDGGSLAGDVKVKFSVAGGKSATGTYTLKGDAQGTGSFAGDLGEKKTSGKLSVLGLGVRRPGAEARLWMYTKDPRFGVEAGGAGWHSLVCGFAGGKGGAGWLCHEKGFASGALADVSLNLADDKLSGGFTATDLKGANRLKVTVAGRVYAGHLVAATLTFGEKGEALPAVGFLMDAGVAPLVQPGSEKGAH